jgi:hypothetical protein
MLAGGMNHYPGRLIHDYEVLIIVYKVKKQALRNNASVRFTTWNQDYSFTCVNRGKQTTFYPINFGPSRTRETPQKAARNMQRAPKHFHQ